MANWTIATIDREQVKKSINIETHEYFYGDFHKFVFITLITCSQIKLVNIRAEDIVDINPKLTLGLIWTIILHFQVHIIVLFQITYEYINYQLVFTFKNGENALEFMSRMIKLIGI